jgi:tetratricopeptide (TPR) repeat protein
MTSRKALLAVTLAAVVVLDVSEATRAESEEAEFIELMGGYLDVSEQFLQFASSSEGAVYFAIEGIIEIYEERGEMRAAIPHLQQILERHADNLTVRTLTRFKLRDLYNETGQQQLALRELEAIIDENR